MSARFVLKSQREKLSRTDQTNEGDKEFIIWLRFLPFGFNTLISFQQGNDFGKLDFVFFVS